MNRIIKLNCPYCGDEILIELDSDFNILSVRINTIKMTEEKISSILKKHGIEFG